MRVPKVWLTRFVLPIRIAQTNFAAKHQRDEGDLTLKRFMWLVLAGVVAPSGIAQAETPRADDRLIAKIDKLVEKNGIHGDEPGVAVLIHQPGELLLQKGYGLANLKTQKPISQHTLFELASVSKTFTATAILMLHDRGKLSIDDDVRQHLPELPVYAKAHPIRVRDLLQHTSGLPDYMNFEDVPARHKTYTVNDDYLALFARHKNEFPLDFPTGQKYEYNNTNYMLLATVVERVGQRPFAKFLEEEIFSPLGMKHSFLYDRPNAAPAVAGDCNHAVGYRWRKGKKAWEPDWGVPPDRHPEMLTVGDGSIWTNLEDMLKWDEAVRAHRLLKPATWKMALTRSQTRDGETNSYGLGWEPYCDDSGELYGYGHDGSWGGFETSYYRYLTADRTTVLLSNRSTFDNDKLWNALQRVVETHLEKE
jgi:CubicO group peptidase (beta-lactamase class C family)